MIPMSKAAVYALLAIYEIGRHREGAANGDGVRSFDIASKYRLPKAYTAKVLSAMASRGLLRADRGPRGGYRLSRGLERISLFDVLDSVGGWVSEDGQNARSLPLPRTLESGVSRAYRSAAAHAREVFDRTMLADLMPD